MQKISKNFGLAVLMTEFSHVFCCVLPTVFTILSFAANLGMISALPVWLMDLHDVIHNYELPIILASSAMLCFGWAVHLISKRVDCHNTGCSHPPCEPTKDRNLKILKIATILLACNVFVFAVIHKNIFELSFLPTAVQHVEHDHEHGNHDSETIENDHDHNAHH
jgi:hypothetical protein